MKKQIIPEEISISREFLLLLSPIRACVLMRGVQVGVRRGYFSKVKKNKKS